eukprot:scaffold1140_cov251-Pinguiococcus_pyrenoidosus.AAC.4
MRCRNRCSELLPGSENVAKICRANVPLGRVAAASSSKFLKYPYPRSTPRSLSATSSSSRHAAKSARPSPKRARGRGHQFPGAKWHPGASRIPKLEIRSLQNSVASAQKTRGSSRSSTTRSPSGWRRARAADGPGSARASPPCREASGWDSPGAAAGVAKAVAELLSWVGFCGATGCEKLVKSGTITGPALGG